MFSRQSMCDFLAEVKKKKKDEEVEDVFVIVTSIQASSRGSMTTNPDKTREPFAHRGQFCTAHPAGPSHGAAKPLVSRPIKASRCDGWSPLAANRLAGQKPRCNSR